MAYGAGGSAAAAHYAAMVQAVKASGAIVKVEPDAFMTILSKSDTPLVVMATGGVFRTNYRYLSAYKGLIFFTQSSAPLQMGKVELVSAKNIWIPS